VTSTEDASRVVSPPPIISITATTPLTGATVRIRSAVASTGPAGASAACPITTTDTRPLIPTTTVPTWATTPVPGGA
jgi:hypothetical protein